MKCNVRRNGVNSHDFNLSAFGKHRLCANNNGNIWALYAKQQQKAKKKGENFNSKPSLKESAPHDLLGITKKKGKNVKFSSTFCFVFNFHKSACTFCSAGWVNNRAKELSEINFAFALCFLLFSGFALGETSDVPLFFATEPFED